MSFALDSFVSFASDFLTSIVDRWTTPRLIFLSHGAKVRIFGCRKNWATTVTKKCGKNCKTKNFLKRKKPTHTHTHSSIKVISPHMDQTWKVKIDLWICFGPKNVSLLGGFNPSEECERQFWVHLPKFRHEKKWNHHLELESWKNLIEIPPLHLRENSSY